MDFHGFQIQTDVLFESPCLLPHNLVGQFKKTLTKMIFLELPLIGGSREVLLEGTCPGRRKTRM
jgi:hypothetical protein